MTTKSKHIVYEYNNHMYTADELIDFANATIEDHNESEITDVDSAIRHLNNFGDESVEVIRKYADGGIVGESVRDYLESIDRTKLPTDVAEYLQNEVLTDENLNMIDTSDDDFLALKQLLDKYKISTPEPKKTTENETTIKLKQEISDLTELIDMEDDKEIINKLKQEINDLNELIDLEQ